MAAPSAPRRRLVEDTGAESRSKAEELAVLDTAIATLGRDSYLGPWLASVRHDVERSIRGDIGPARLPSETSVACQQLLDEAAHRAGRIVAEAEREAARVKAAAFGIRDRVLQDTSKALRLAYETLDGVRR